MSETSASPRASSLDRDEEVLILSNKIQSDYLLANYATRVTA